MDVILKVPNESYYKPIVYINVLTVMYPQMYKIKKIRGNLNEELTNFQYIYRLMIKLCKEYFVNYKKNEELINLKKGGEGKGYEFDGDDFESLIAVLKNRVVEKQNQFKIVEWREFEEKASIYYYFMKQK